MYLLHWDSASNNFGDIAIVECVEAPSAADYTDDGKRTYIAGQRYNAQKLHTFGDGWIVALVIEGNEYTGFTFSTSEFSQFFKVVEKRNVKAA